VRSRLESSSTMACHCRVSLLFDAKRYVGAGSSWLASTGDGAGQMGNHLERTRLCRAARGRTT
jgi:hypothetical protein